MHSAITAGISALKGPLHGGANEKAMEMLLEIGTAGSVPSFVDRALEQKQKIMGFGHRVYRTEDPRATHLRRMAEELSLEAGDSRWYDVSRRLEVEMLEPFRFEPTLREEGYEVDKDSNTLFVDRFLHTAMFYPCNYGFVPHTLAEDGDPRAALVKLRSVLRPGGAALLQRNGGWAKVIKPHPDGLDDWTHYLHDASNNAVSHDTVVAPPRRLQWLGGPRWARHHDRMSSVSAVVSSGGLRRETTALPFHFAPPFSRCTRPANSCRQSFAISSRSILTKAADR